MLLAYTYPCVFIEETLSAIRTITGVPTSITAFAGRVLRRPNDRPMWIQSFVGRRPAMFARTTFHRITARLCRRLSSNDRPLMGGYERLHTGTG